MDPQTTKILKWLKMKLGDKPISPYEVNVWTTNILFHLAEYNETRDHDISLVIEDLKLKTKETVAAANDLADLLLEIIGRSFKCFSRTGNSYLNLLVDCALELDLKNTSLGSYALAISELSSSLGEAEFKNQQLEKELVSLREKYTAALELKKTLEQDLEKVEGQCAVESVTVNTRLKDMLFLNTKRKETETRIQWAEEQLSAREIDPSLTHFSLVALSEKLEKLKEEAVELNGKLEAYMDLSPNISLAELQLDAARREAAALGAELAEKVDILSHGLSYDLNQRHT